jgi:hypothetical protein
MHTPHSVDRELPCRKLKTRIERDFQDNCFHLQTINTNVLIYVTPHPPLPLKGGGVGRG